jgi:hypothetical protein
MKKDVPAPCPPRFQSAGDIALLRKDLEAAGFTPQAVLERIGLKEAHEIVQEDLPLLLMRTSEGNALDTAIRLFLMSLSVGADAVPRVFPSLDPRVLLKSGLIRMDQGQAVATIRILPFQGLLVCYDRLDRLRTPAAVDYVMGVSGSSVTLATSTIRRPDGRTLDLGTGCGIQALLAASHSRQVVALDRNPRALEFARFNAVLNQVSNVEFRGGDLFEPVEGETFDLIVTNPPFVISPETRYIYRDGGRRGDEICRTIVREAPRFLSEGSFLQMLCNWVEPGEENWSSGIREWFAGNECDAWVIRSHSQDTATYASKWVRHTELREPDSWLTRVEEWCSYYKAEGIERIGSGLVTMRRACGRANWVRAEQAPSSILGPCGASILRRFQAQDFLETVSSDTDLLGHCFRVSPDARLQSRSAPATDGWQMEQASLELVKGLAYSGQVDVAIANLVVHCDGEKPLGELVDEMAQSLGADREKILVPVCAVVRGLLEQGFLLP